MGRGPRRPRPDRLGRALLGARTSASLRSAWFGNGQKDLALGASDISRTCAQLRAGDPLELTVATARERARILEALDAAGASRMADVNAQANQLLTLKNQALTVPSDPPDVVENQPWTRWMAGLLGSANEMLDNDVLEDYLGPKGKKMFDAGGWMSDADQADIVRAAQRRIRGCTATPSASTRSRPGSHRRRWAESANDQLAGGLRGCRIMDTAAAFAAANPHDLC